MARNTSILLGEHFENFIDDLIATGKYNSVSEVVRTALRLFETEEAKARFLVDELKKGEKSGKVANFNRDLYLKSLHATHHK